ncbi:hypothetical protein TNCV_1101 [Trichonephila clavipes]|nr:hypothetical protein TNCV_1101 [Trichonephila clavipes]
MLTGKSHMGLSLMNRRGYGSTLGRVLARRSICRCVVMRKIPVVTLPEPRPFTANGFPQKTSSGSVYLQQFVQVFDDNFFEHIQAPF